MTVTFELPDELADRLRDLCYGQGVSVGENVYRAVVAILLGHRPATEAERTQKERDLLFAALEYYGDALWLAVCTLDTARLKEEWTPQATDMIANLRLREALLGARGILNSMERPK